MINVAQIAARLQAYNLLVC